MEFTKSMQATTATPLAGGSGNSPLSKDSAYVSLFLSSSSVTLILNAHFLGGSQLSANDDIPQRLAHPYGFPKYARKGQPATFLLSYSRKTLGREWSSKDAPGSTACHHSGVLQGVTAPGNAEGRGQEHVRESDDDQVPPDHESRGD